MQENVLLFDISKPKTEAGIRIIPLMDTVYDALANEYERQKQNGFCEYELEDMQGFIFSNRNGSLHHLRHTFCSRLIENGVNPKITQQIMSHKNIETTLDIYTEISFEKQQQSLEELAKKIDFF